MGKRGKIKQRERRKLLRRAERKGSKEEMLKTLNEYDNKDLTPHNTVGTMIYQDFAVKYR